MGAWVDLLASQTHHWQQCGMMMMQKAGEATKVSGSRPVSGGLVP